MKSNSFNTTFTALFFALTITACINNQPAENVTPATPVMDTIEVETSDTLMVEDSTGKITQKIEVKKEIKIIERK